MLMIYGESPISYQAPTEKLDKNTVYYTNDANETMKKKVTIFNGDSGNMEHYCEMRQDFDMTMQEWNLTTGPHHFEIFPMFLDGTARIKWGQVMQTRNVAHNNINHFRQAVETWLQKQWKTQSWLFALLRFPFH